MKNSLPASLEILAKTPMRHALSFPKKIFFLVTLIGLLTALSVTAKDLSYANPVLAGDYPDPSVIRVGRDYWATATTSEWAPLFPILYSQDLVHWEHIGNVFEKRPEWSVGNYWAPEITEYRGKFYIYYVGRKRNGPLSIAVATADKASGPYTDHGPLIGQDAGSIDPIAVTDEHGDRYLIWKEDGNSRKLPTPLWAQKLSPDGTKLVGEMKELMRNDFPWEGSLIEGPFVMKRAGWFYLFYSGNACCGRGCDYAVGVARSKSLLGPWEKNPANPILAGNAVWKCPGHGTIVTDPDGRDFFLYHAYHAEDFVYVGRQGLLDEIKWGANGWPTINDGKGPSQTVPATASRPVTTPFTDEFSGQSLKPEWQWPQGRQPSVKLQDGMLLLSPIAEDKSDPLAAVLAVKTTSGTYEATTLVNRSEAAAGLSAFGDSENALGMTLNGTSVTLWKLQKNQRQVLAQANLPLSPSAYLKLTATAGHKFRFAISHNGNDWIHLGQDVDVEGNYLPPWDRGIRIALTASGSPAKFDWLRIRPTTP